MKRLLVICAAVAAHVVNGAGSPVGPGDYRVETAEDVS